MKVSVRTHGMEGLGPRLARAVLAPAAAVRATAAATQLASDITRETGARPVVGEASGRPVVRVTDEAVLARVRGTQEQPGEPVLDRVRLAFARRSGATGESLP